MIETIKVCFVPAINNGIKILFNFIWDMVLFCSVIIITFFNRVNINLLHALIPHYEEKLVDEHNLNKKLEYQNMMLHNQNERLKAYVTSLSSVNENLDSKLRSASNTIRLLSTSMEYVQETQFLENMSQTILTLTEIDNLIKKNLSNFLCSEEVITYNSEKNMEMIIDSESTNQNIKSKTLKQKIRKVYPKKKTVDQSESYLQNRWAPSKTKPLVSCCNNNDVTDLRSPVLNKSQLMARASGRVQKAKNRRNSVKVSKSSVLSTYKKQSSESQATQVIKKQILK